MLSHYQSMAHQQGSLDALSLAADLELWHDRMVAHQRAIATTSARRCDDECPHAEAIELWRLAVSSFGEAADRLVFLKTTATAALRHTTARESVGRARTVAR
jgi:hypothetical protein